MMEKFFDEMFNAEEISYSISNDHYNFCGVINVFDVEGDDDEIIIYGDGSSKAEFSLDKHPDEIIKDDEGWQLKYGPEIILVSVIR